MGDSSDEEFYSAPESDDDKSTDKNTSLHHDTPEQTLERLSVSEGSNPSQSESKNESCGERPHNTAKVGEDDKTSERVAGPENKKNDEHETCSADPGSTKVKQEFMKGLDNRFVSDDHEVLEGGKVELSEEQVKELKEEANRLKTEGNTKFKNGDYIEAIESYSNALKLYPPSQCDHEIAVCYANRAACHMKLNDHESVIEDCTHTLEIEPSYLKAILRRAQANEALEKYEDALTDYKRTLEIDPTQDSARQAVIYLPDKIKEQNEKLKEEMLGKLKELGNAVLKPFGLSTNNFQLQQDPQTGSYSMNFKR